MKQLILISILSLSSFSFSVTDCKTFAKIALLEQRLANAIPVDGEYFHVPEKIALPTIQREYDLLKELLGLKKVKFRSPTKRAIRKKHTPAINFEIEDGNIEASPLHSDWLFEIQSVVESETPIDHLPTASVYTHPKAPDILARLSKMRIHVYADPTLGLIGYGGLFNTNKKYILLPASARFLDLVHEAAHAEFDFFHVEEFIDKGIGKAPDSRSLRKLIRSPRYLGYGEERLLRVLSLARESYPKNSIDELMAVEAEHFLLREAGFDESHTTFTQSQGYARWHLLNDLANKIIDQPLTLREKQLFLRGVFENLLNAGDGDLHGQFKLGRKLVALLKKTGLDVKLLPDFGDIRLEAFQQHELKRKIVIGSGVATISSGVIIALYFTLGKTITLFTNPPSSPAVPNADDEEKMEGSKES